jgi:succinate dehydrogenase/fumarate reductase-like Fe-S protein
MDVTSTALAARSFPPARSPEAPGFGGCSNEAECRAVCPKSIPTSVIQRMNSDYARALLKGF